MSATAGMALAENAIYFGLAVLFFSFMYPAHARPDSSPATRTSGAIVIACA